MSMRLLLSSQFVLQFARFMYLFMYLFIRSCSSVSSQALAAFLLVLMNSAPPSCLCRCSDRGRFDGSLSLFFSWSSYLLRCDFLTQPFSFLRDDAAVIASLSSTRPEKKTKPNRPSAHFLVPAVTSCLRLSAPSPLVAPEDVKLHERLT